MAEGQQSGAEPAGAPGAAAPAPKAPEKSGAWREGRKWFLTTFLVLLVLVIIVVLYALKFRPMEFFYVLF